VDQTSQHAAIGDIPIIGLDRFKNVAEATRLYETILSTTDDFAYVFNPQGQFLYANPPLLKVWAKTIDQVVGKTCYDLGYPTWHADMHMREIEQIVRTRQDIRGEVPFTGNSGIFGVYDYIFKPVLDSTGHVEFIVGTTRDVTARKQAEEKLASALKARAESELRYRFLADSIPQIAWTAKPDGNLDYYNQRWFDYAGTTLEEMERVHWTHYVYPDDLPNAIKVWQKSLDTGCDYEVEFRLIRASDKTYRWHLVRAFPMKDEAGAVLQWIGTCTDIDDRQRAQAQSEFLARLTQQLSTVSDSAELNRVAVREIGQFLHVHRCYFFNAYPDVHHVRMWPEWCSDDSPTVEGIYTLAEYGEPKWWAAIQTRAVSVNDVRADPLTRNFQPNYSALKIAAYALSPFVHEGGWKACITVTSDVPRVWTLEEMSLLENAVARVWPLLERAQIEEDLERLVGERTASLQEAMTQMEEFSYSVSHDLRAPLRAMQGYASALLEDYGDKFDDEAQAYLRHIVSAGNRMDRLTRDVLVYSKIPRTSFQVQAIDLDKLVSEIVQQNLPARSKVTSVIIENPLLSVLGNESFLAQSVSNLIDNAVKFASKERSLRIRIWTEPRQQQVRLWVEDNGIGVLPEHQGRIWGMFERVHPQHMYEGTGIGLAIVRKTVERMNGTMGMESDGVTGSKFWIQLPGGQPQT
jgi:PAS domain S-box-containing protein